MSTPGATGPARLGAGLGARLGVRVKAFGAFWFDFVIGDDWRVAALVAAGLLVTHLLARTVSFPVWWVMPLAVLVALPTSLWRAVRASRRG